MNDRTGQVWWARDSMFYHNFEPCVILRRATTTSDIAWTMRPLEKLADYREEFMMYESSFRSVEAGADDAYVRERIA